MEKPDESKSRSGFAAVKRVFGYGILICFIFLFVGFLCICFSIRSSVKEISAMAVREFPGDRIVALMTYVDSKNLDKVFTHTVYDAIAAQDDLSNQ